MALKDFDSGFGYRRGDLIDAGRLSRLYENAVSAGSGSLLRNLDRDLGDIVGDLVKTGRAKPYGVGSLWTDASGILAGADRPSVTDKWPFGSSGVLDRVLTSDRLSDPLRTNIQKQIAAADADLKSASKGLTGLSSIASVSEVASASKGLTGLSSFAYSDVAKVRNLPSAMQDVWRAEASIKEASTAYGRLTTRFDDLSAAHGRMDRLTAGVGNLSALGRYAPAVAGFIPKSVEEQMADLRLLLKPSVGLYRIPPHDVLGFGSVIRAATTYGPVVVTPDGPPPPPPDYTPSLRTFIPDTTSSADDAPTIEDVWAEVVALAQEMAQRYKGHVVIRALGPKGEIVLWGLITNAIYDVILHVVTR